MRAGSGRVLRPHVLAALTPEAQMARTWLGFGIGVRVRCGFNVGRTGALTDELERVFVRGELDMAGGVTRHARTVSTGLFAPSGGMAHAGWSNAGAQLN